LASGWWEPSPAEEVQVEASQSGSSETLSKVHADAIAVDDDLDARILVVSSPILERLLIAAPIGVGLVLALGRFYVDDPMFGTGLLTVVIAFVVFQVFARRIPDSFARLAAREVVQAADRARFADFQRTTTRLLNDPLGLVPGVVFALFALARFPVVAGGIDRFLGNGPRSIGSAGVLMLLDMFGEALLGLALGLVLWRMLIVALRMHELGNRFDLHLKLNHPDRCGGFRPLGDLCLWNALLVTVPAIYLAAWIVLAPRTPYGTTYVGLHTTFLAVLAVLAPITFIAPLWSVHGEMLRESARLRAEVDQVGQQIDRLSRELLERSEQMSADEAAATAHDLEIRQANYKRTEQIPTWPIDVSLALRFSTSQLIPLLSLTGLGKPIVDAIDRFGKFVAPS